MRGAPDRDEALRDQTVVFRTVDLLLARERGAVHGECVTANAGTPRARSHWTYPGRVAAAFAIQQQDRSRPGAGEAADRVRSIEAQAVAHAVRTTNSGPPDWPVDLASPEPHLARSLSTALRQLPDTADPSWLATWSVDERAVFDAAADTLAAFWPAMRAELAVTVRQVALLSGPAINGFTDFAAHGAVFVARARLTEADGLPGHVRLAESLVHEGTHTRCNAAAVGAPFLLDTKDATRLRVATPLRADHRPLAGLFQQLVVLVRCAELYERLRGAPGIAEDVVLRRQEQLAAQARQAVEGLEVHRSLLSPCGKAVLDEMCGYAAVAGRGDACDW